MKSKEQTIQLFFRFLKDNNVYGAFIKRFHRHFMRKPDYFYKKPPSLYIMGAFAWDNDNINWGGIHTKWCQKIGF